MASIGVINADKVDTIKPEERDKYSYLFIFGVFFDGTGNNMIQPQRANNLHKQLIAAGQIEDAEFLELINANLNLSDNAANPIDEISDNESDFSNVAVLHNWYYGMSDNERQSCKDNNVVTNLFNIYVEGAGTDEEYSGSMAQKAHNWRGSGFGKGHTGVPALVAKAMTLVQQRVNGFVITEKDEVRFDVFGFSRGATCARMFSHMVGPDQKLECLPKEVEALNFLNKFEGDKRSVDFLGIFDTVSSIGFKYDDNTTEYGLYSPNEPWVKHTLHIAAMDELRDHFRLTDVGEAVSSTALELFIPGCHSDVGGGYKTGSQRVAIRYSVDRNWNTSVTDRLYRWATNALYRQLRDYQPGNALTSLTSQAVDIDADSLERLGWHSTGRAGYSLSTDYVNGFYNLTRNIDRGYSNIPLEMMYTRAINQTKRHCFVADKSSRYSQFPGLLKTLEGSLMGLIGKESGRYFHIPADYRALREQFIHYSANDALLSIHTKVVHAPTEDGRCLTRIIYHGDKSDAAQHFIHEY